MRIQFNRTKETINLTEGPIGRQLIRFALPLFLGSLLQLLYNTVDLIFAGQFLGKEASAAVGASSLIVTCILGFFTGMSVGVGVVIAKAVGEGDSLRVHRAIHTAAGMTILFAVLFTAAGLLLAPAVLRWMDTPEDIMASALVYLRLYLCSLFSIVSYNIGSGILRALGNSSAPMRYQLFGGIANVFGNAFFICVLDWGVRGIAMATVCSQTLAAVFTILHLWKLEGEVQFRFRKIALDFGICRKILSIGIPAAVQAIVITLSNLIVQANINRLGVDSIAAFTAYFKVENFIYLPIMAFGSASSTFTSQNCGASLPQRVKKGTRMAILLGIATTMVTSWTVLLFAEQLFGLFATEAEVITLGMQIAWTTYPFYFIYVFLEVFASTIRGAGKTLVTMVIIVVNMCLVRTAALTVMMHLNPTVTGVAIIYPLTWTCTAVCLFLYYKKGRWLAEQQKSKTS